MKKILFLIVVWAIYIHSYGRQGNVDTYVAVNALEDANTFVVIISNENYQFEESVPFALNDGATFRLYCEKTLGIPEKNIRFTKNATLNVMRYEISWLERMINVMNGKARAILYYSGHGMPDESSKKAYLLPVDGYSTESSTGFCTEELYQRLGQMASTQTLVFIDACFSGAKREGGMISSSRGVAIRTKKESVNGNLVVFSAASGNETAYPLKSEEHGLFTYYLLEKLQQTGGGTTLGELSDYVVEKVSISSIQENEKSQTPTIIASADNQGWRNWLLAKQGATQYVNIPKALVTDIAMQVSSTASQSEPLNAAKITATLDMSTGGAFSLAGVVYEMVRVESGVFLMGSKALTNAYSTFSLDGPPHRVTLKPYAIGKTEVSQALWEAVMGNNPSAHKGANLPVENVSWDDCQQFLSRLNTICGTNFRLPTEAEWEYAADGCNDRMSETYVGTTRLNAVAHIGDTTVECGSKIASSLGLVDMAGNVAEWCQDYFGRYPSSNQDNPQGPATGYQRVVRGGSFQDMPVMMRNSHRSHQRPSVASPTVGLRLAHDL